MTDILIWSDDFDGDYKGSTGKIKSKVVDGHDVLFLVQPDKPRNVHEEVQGIFCEPKDLKVFNRKAFYQLVACLTDACDKNHYQPQNFYVFSEYAIAFTYIDKEVIVQHLDGIPTFYMHDGLRFIYHNARLSKPPFCRGSYAAAEYQAKQPAALARQNSLYSKTNDNKV